MIRRAGRRLKHLRLARETKALITLESAIVSMYLNQPVLLAHGLRASGRLALMDRWARLLSSTHDA